MAEHLEACPFCGEDDARLIADDPGIAWVQCPHCEGEGPPATGSARAIERWNTRLNPPAASGGGLNQGFSPSRDHASSASSALDGDVTHYVREAARRVTGGSCAFVIDDIDIMEHLAIRAVEAGLADRLHPSVAAKAAALHPPVQEAVSEGSRDAQNPLKSTPLVRGGE